MRDHKQWIMRLLSLGLILAMGACYQIRALAWQRQVTANQNRIREIETYNAEITRQEAQLQRELEAALAARENPEESGAEPAAEAEAEIPQIFLDGEYTASAMGFGGDIQVTVTMAGDYIERITLDSHEAEDAVYFAAAEEIVDRILEAQTPDVDTVTGATMSSTGIREAVRLAMEQARSGA